MDLRKYFANVQGAGVLAKADSEGTVNTAIYSRPHVFDDGTIAFVMRQRLIHHNLQTNSYSSYLFRESGSGYRGSRLYLKKIKEKLNRRSLQK